MAETLLNIDEVCKELQLNKEQVLALVKQGSLRGLRDAGTFKFRKADVDSFKKKAESGATVVFESPTGAPGKVDLSGIESEEGADESDQTSVLAPVDEKAAGEKADEQPVFEFSEKELDLPLDKQAEEESDQTSVLAPVDEKAAGGEAEEEPVFEFSEKELGMPLDKEGEGAESVLVADESDSSLDILEVADESSSDSATSAAELDFVDESSSGEDLAAVTTGEEAPPSEAKPGAEGGSTVTDILGAEEEEELETVDLDEIVETQGTGIGEAEPVTAVEEEIPTERPATETAETMAVGGEAETVGIALGDEATQGLAAEAIPVEELAAAPEEEYEAAHVAAGWGMVTPSVMGNLFLVLSILTMALAGMFLLCALTGTVNPVTQLFAQYVAVHFP